MIDNFDMKYERVKYPDSQISVKILDPLGTMIIERINSYEDLIFIRSIAEASERKLSLTIPCLFGQRSDRRFDKNQSFDLKIIAEIINSCNFESVRILDPHSDVSLALINNSYKLDSGDYVKESLYNIDRAYKDTDIVLVSPDAGAYKKVFGYGEEFSLPIVAAVKHRDKEGKVDLTFMGDVKGKDCLIVDDLADGAFTFVKLAEALKAQGASRIFLYVTHGYFSKGFDELKKNITHIFCTNSVKDIEEGYITQYKVV